jgi:polysaccharide export outer membrane protein
MKNINRSLLCASSILCLMVATSGRLTAQGIESRGAESVVAASAGNTVASNEASAPVSDNQVRVGPGDLLEVRVFDVPELTQTIRVNDLGDASLALIGRLHLADLTPDEARDAITQKFVDGHFLVNPQVSVLIQQYGTQGVFVLGEVQRPGVYSMLGSRTLLDVISQAGGTTVFAGSSVTVKRKSDGTLLTISLTRNAKNMLAANSDVQLEPGDKVVIPRASVVYVLGDVGRPGGFLMQNNGRITILQAVALAGGQNHTASMGHIRLIHKTDSGYTDIAVPLKKIINGQVPDSELQAEDILYIPRSGPKSLIYRTVPGVVQSASSAAIYGAIF